MKERSTVTASELQSRTPKILREAGRRGMLAVTEKGHVTAFLVSRDRVMAMIETMEFLSNPEAMAAVREFESGKGKFYSVDELDAEMKAWTRKSAWSGAWKIFFTLAPEPCRAVWQAIKKLPAGGVKPLEGKLVGWSRLRVTHHRVLFRETAEGGVRKMDCVFAERRGVVYEMFAELLANELMER